jgi:hypothetical protein
MTLNQFNSMSKNQKVVTVCNYGKYLGNRSSNNEILSYYIMDTVFVELVYDVEVSKLMEVRSCSVGQGLYQFS